MNTTPEGVPFVGFDGALQDTVGVSDLTPEGVPFTLPSTVLDITSPDGNPYIP